jgi:hypothetical protein
MAPDIVEAFLGHLRAAQGKFLTELKAYNSGKMRIGTRTVGGIWRDITEQHVASIRGEIASLERTIQSVIAQQEMERSNRAPIKLAFSS